MGTFPDCTRQKKFASDRYEYLLTKAIEGGKKQGLSGQALVVEVCDKLAVSIGCEILKVVPGYVSTEVDANLSFDTEASVAKAKKIIKMYEEQGIKKEHDPPADSEN